MDLEEGELGHSQSQLSLTFVVSYYYQNLYVFHVYIIEVIK